MQIAADRAPVYFTGHSLGAALATIAVTRYQGAPCGLYTYGSPRVADDLFVTSGWPKPDAMGCRRFSVEFQEATSADGSLHMRNHRSLRDSIDRPAVLWCDIERIRAAAPLVHSITNFVVMNTTANALLALGASPVMAHAAEEVADMAAAAAALVVNIGTLSPTWVESMSIAMRSAARAGRPIVFDPVGAGATAYRTESCRRLIEETPPSIVRGNASEIRALAGASSATKGVDSADDSETALESARFLAGRCGCVVVSGAVDLVVSAGRVTRLSNGHPMMPRITGLGCTATALIGAFAAVNSSLPDAAAHAMAVMGIAGELAAVESPGPGTFQVKFLDALYGLTEADVRARLKMEIA